MDTTLYNSQPSDVYHVTSIC